MDKLIIVGAGGHGKVVADTALLTGKWNIIGFVDDVIKKDTVVFNGLKVIGNSNEMNELKKMATHFVIAIGDNKMRASLFSKCLPFLKPASIIHPNAFVSNFSEIGECSVILANAVVNVNVQIGVNCIINSLSLIDHDSKIGDHSHIAQATIVGSTCTLPDQYHSKLGEHIPSYTKLT